MRLVPLLFDPRGALERRGFWSGLLQLTVLSLAVCLGLTGLGWTVALAALPLVGEAFTVGGVAGRVYGAEAPDLLLVLSLVLVATRLYATACLMLKRARDAGKGARVVGAFGLASLLVHVVAGLCAYAVYGEDMAVILPMIADLAVTGLLSLGFVIWLGASRSLASRPPGQAKGRGPAAPLTRVQP